MILKYFDKVRKTSWGLAVPNSAKILLTVDYLVATFRTLMLLPPILNFNVKLLGSVQVLYKHIRGGGSEGNAYFAYVKDQNSYSPGNGF